MPNPPPLLSATIVSMKLSRRHWLLLATTSLAAATREEEKVTRYVRFQHGSNVSYGILEGDLVYPISGDLFGQYKRSSSPLKLRETKLLCPCQPQKVLAVGLNYRSHLAGRPVPKRPEIFYKPVTSLQHPGDPILIPPDAHNVHYEGEMVIVLGKRLKRASLDEAAEAIFGVTCGNDVSEREWQNGPDRDLQWWRAKGCDTFGPVGPCIVRGLDYRKLMLRTRLNGQVVQEQSTGDLIFDPPTILSWISQYVTLMPGDLVFTGTPGQTGSIKPGDVVEVELEGVGVLRNPVERG